MSMQQERCWVIKNQDNYYVNPKFKVLFTGLCTGFTGYTDKETMQKDLDMLGEGYYSEYIYYKNIPEGRRVYKE